ncbi:MAG: PP2C family protein-serine/threonine phosphatase [Acidimicrobiales bacterium]
MAQLDVVGALRAARTTDPGAIPEILAQASAAIGASDLVVYLVDFGRTVLEPLPDRAAHAELPTTENVSATMAGRAFLDQSVLTAERPGGSRVWAPILEGSDCTGVVALTLARARPSHLRACADLGLLAGYLIAAHARCTDLYNLHRRRRSMALPASMQWDLLPPLVVDTGVVAAAGHVEPAYEVGGDAFDYAANGPVFDFAVMDAMGHGLTSAQVASLAIGAYRHGRREARSLIALHESLAATITAQHPGTSFVAGTLGRIDTATGILTRTNAGFPLPLLVRHGRVVGELACTPTPPWGLLEGTPTLATDALEPGDCVMVYSDGVTDARTPDGELFGLDRLIDVTQSNASDLLAPTEMIRLVIRCVLEHRDAELADDATVVLLRWAGPTAE